jgi:hypothetical protein
LYYWHWLVFRHVADHSPSCSSLSFSIFWFGLGAILLSRVGLALRPDWPWPGSLFSGLWLRWPSPSCGSDFSAPLMADRTKAGLSREAAMGESGQVIKAPLENQRGGGPFTMPLLGAV